MADWGSIIGGLSPLAFGAVGALTAQPNTTSTAKQNTFLTPQSEGLFNQGIGLAGQAVTQPYASNSWIENAQRMLGATALDTTPGNVIGQTAETLGGLSNQLGSMQGGANWNANPGAMQSAVQANMNPYNTLVRDQTMQYAQEAADRANAANQAAASANASQFGDRSQIALELGKQKQQQNLNALRGQLDQQGFAQALAQTNVNNALGRADIGQQAGLAMQQPSLAQMNRANQIGNAQLLQTEGIAQRDFPWQQANNAINAATKTMGSNTLQSTSVNPWTTGLSAGLAALNPAVQAGISSGVNALGSIFGAGTSAPDLSAAGLDSIFGTDYGALGSMGSDATSALEGLGIFMKRGGHVSKFKRGGIARFDNGGQAEDVEYEELPPFEVTDSREGSTTGELPEGVTVGGAARFPGATRPAPAGNAAPRSAASLEDEYMRRLMQAPDPAEMRTARDDERRAMSALLAEYKPRQNDGMRALSDLGVGMADPTNRSFGNAFARGVGYMQQGIDQRDQLDRQAKRELAQIQLRMASENRKELTEQERTRLTTLASMIKERNAEAERRERADADRASRELIASGQREVLREGQQTRTALAAESQAASDERAFNRQIADWNTLLARQEPGWRRAAIAASANVHPEDAPAFIEDFVQARREEFEARTPRPERPASPPAATAGAPRPASPTTPAPTAPTSPAPSAAAPARTPPTDAAVPPPPAPTAPDPAAARLGYRPRPAAAGDTAENEVVARRLNVPAISTPPWRGLSTKKAEDLIIKERQDFLKGDDDREKDVQQAERIEQLGKEYLALNARAETGTGALNIPIAKQIQVFSNADLQRMEAITAELSPLNRIAGTGAVSDFDARQLVAQSPSVEKTPEANRMILEYRLRAAQNVREKVEFERAYFEANQTMQGARRAWDEYKNANPLAVEVKLQKGSAKEGSLPFRLNENRLTWQEHFRLKDLEAREKGGK